MKKLLLFAVAIAFLSSCGKNDRGELVGAKGKRWYSEKPYGMTLIPGGSFIMGKSDDDLANSMNAPTRTVTVPSFYMDETEITNSEYRQFVEWVRDSVVRTKLADFAELNSLTPEEGGIGDFAYKDVDTTDLNEYQKYMVEKAMLSSTYSGRRLNWDVDLIWNHNDYPDEFYTEIMVDSVYIPVEEAFNGQTTVKSDIMNFRYTWMDIEGAAKNKDKKKTRKDFIKTEIVPIYPDTTVWVKDFEYAYNEPMHNEYFWHSAYDEYPVVGVTWKQAKAFCEWRYLYKNIFNAKAGVQPVNKFRLPTEAEWEYAARGGIESGTYPWGGPYMFNSTGCFLANFKPLRGDYAADQALYTVEAESFEANDFGLYNMAGNVAEWTNSTYDPESYEYESTMSPNVIDSLNRKKVIRGGSWKDVAYMLQVSTRDWEYQDSARSYIGFRTVQDYMGTDVVYH